MWQLDVAEHRIRHRVAIGRLHRVHQGVYAVGHSRLTRKGRWMAAVLAHGPQAVLSHRAALALWELRPTAPGPINVTVPARGRRSTGEIRAHNVRTPPDSTRVDGIPVSTVAQTLLDVAETLGRQQLRLAVEAADRRELLDGRAIDALIRRSPGRHGAPALRAALATLTGYAPWTQSELERAFLAFTRAHGLPEPQCNVLIAGALVDAYFPHARLIVEVDGYQWHRGRAQFEEDRRRDVALMLAGYRVIRLTQRRLIEEPERVALELSTLLRASA